MREALARSDFNATRRSPAQTRGRKSGTSTKGRQRRKSNAQPASHLITTLGAFLASAILAGLMFVGHYLLTIVQRYPVAVVGSLVGVALSTSIIINATSRQEGFHPSPIFAQGHAPKAAALKTAAQKAAPKAIATAASIPPPRPAESNAQAIAASPLSTKVIAPAAQIAATDDPIANLIANGAPPQPVKAAQGSIMPVQQALVKLGYAITPDGRAGPATQQAIAAFEKLEDLPVTGDPMNTAMRKALSVASGMSLN